MFSPGKRLLGPIIKQWNSCDVILHAQIKITETSLHKKTTPECRKKHGKCYEWQTELDMLFMPVSRVKHFML